MNEFLKETALGVEHSFITTCPIRVLGTLSADVLAAVSVVRSPPARRSLSWIQSLLTDFWLLVIEVSTLSLILLTTQTMVTTGIIPPQGKSPW